MVLGSVGRGYCKKNRVLEFLAKIFGQVVSAPLNHGLVFKKVYRVIKLNQKARLKSYIEMNKELGKKAKNDFEK